MAYIGGKLVPTNSYDPAVVRYDANGMPVGVDGLVVEYDSVASRDRALYELPREIAQVQAELTAEAKMLLGNLGTDPTKRTPPPPGSVAARLEEIERRYPGDDQSGERMRENAKIMNELLADIAKQDAAEHEKFMQELYRAADQIQQSVTKPAVTDSEELDRLLDEIEKGE